MTTTDDVADDDLARVVCEIVEEFRRARHRLGLSDAELALAARSSVLASAAPADIVRRALVAIDAWRGR